MQYPIKKEKQSGITLLGLMILGALMGFWVYVVIKVIPIYIEAAGVQAVFKDFEREYEQAQGLDRKIIDYFERGFQVNNVRGVNVEDIDIKKTKKEIKVTLSYEIREHLVHNIAMILRFDNDVVVPRTLDFGK